MKQIEVRIMGQNYLLGCAEGAEQELMDAVRVVDREMCGIRDGGKLRARERIAVLAALNLAVILGKQPEPTENNEPPLITVADPSLQELREQIDAQCNELIERIDQTLGSDGQLL